KNVNPAGDGEARSLQRDETLARHLFQIGKCRIDRTGAKLTGVLGNAVEPAIDEKYRALPWLAITAVGFRRGVPQATDIAHVPADGALHRLGNHGLMPTPRVVEIGFSESQ